MRIAVGADHGGYPLNVRVIEELRNAGHELIDFGTHDGSVPDDYPDYARWLVKRCRTTLLRLGF